MKQDLVALFAILTLSCSSMSDLSTVYRSPERARTVLTALQTLRYGAAQEVAKACVQSRITPEQCRQFQAVDDKFRSAWGVASELVQVWIVSKGEAPATFQAKMAEVETLAAQLGEEKRKVE